MDINLGFMALHSIQQNTSLCRKRAREEREVTEKEAKMKAARIVADAFAQQEKEEKRKEKFKTMNSNRNHGFTQPNIDEKKSPQEEKDFRHECDYWLRRFDEFMRNKDDSLMRLALKAAGFKIKAKEYEGIFAHDEVFATKGNVFSIMYTISCGDIRSYSQLEIKINNLEIRRYSLHDDVTPAICDFIMKELQAVKDIFEEQEIERHNRELAKIKKAEEAIEMIKSNPTALEDQSSKQKNQRKISLMDVFSKFFRLRK